MERVGAPNIEQIGGSKKKQGTIESVQTEDIQCYSMDSQFSIEVKQFTTGGLRPVVSVGISMNLYITN